MNQSSISIYDKYGGYDFFHDCIYELYLDMFDHPEIAYHFIGVDIIRLSTLQTQYLIQAIGGPRLYQGGVIKEVHSTMNITPFQFKEIAKSFREIFLKNGVSNEDADFIMNFISEHKNVIVTSKTSFIDRIMRPIYKLGSWIAKKFQ